MNKLGSRKGSGDASGIIILVVVGFALWGIYSFFSSSAIFGGEVQGTVKYDDCRQVINLKEGDSNTYFKKFTCDTLKTNDGRVISGECVHVDLNSNGSCDTAYIYEKTPQITCSTNQEATVSGTCVCDYGYVMSGGSCISEDQSCKNLYGSGSYSGLDNLCYCSSGYMWNSLKTSCISIYSF